MKQIDSMSEQDLAEIVERASTVDERLSGDFSPAGGDEALVDERLEAWCQALGKGDWDRFERRLAWDGLDLETIRPALGPVRLREGAACRSGRSSSRRRSAWPHPSDGRRRTRRGLPRWASWTPRIP